MTHLDEVGETYWQHFAFAARIGLILFITSFLIVLHAIFPFMFKRTGSEVIKSLYDLLENRGSDDEDIGTGTE